VIADERTIKAPAAQVFKAVLEAMGPSFLGADGKSLGLRLEARPGGHWSREVDPSILYVR
jgi:uncharacterized protein YndB with AHSA1/START domain